MPTRITGTRQSCVLLFQPVCLYKDFWLFKVFPSESIGEILQETNARLKSRQKRITKGELCKAIRLLYAVTLDVRRQRRDY